VGRILAIDYGKKRIGIAVTDPLQIIATGLTTVETAKIWDFLTKYFLHESVDYVVVGLAKQMNNEPSEIMGDIDTFITKFKTLFPDKKVEMYDERFTSKLAVRAMIDGGLKKKARQNKALVDTISATILLQSFLNLIQNKPIV